jgi:hypothetical protein
MKQTLVGFYVLTFLLSCKHTIEKPIIAALSDTAQILQIAVAEGISLRYMPHASSLYSTTSSDTVFITSNVLPLRLLPTESGSTHFLVLQKADICSQIGQRDISELPRYFLEVRAFEKSDTGYYVSLRAIGCSMYSSGGSLGLYFQKSSNSYIVVDRSSGSIN